MFRFLFLLCLFFSMALQADIYKCDENGLVHYQDKPCQSHSEKVEIKLHQPSKKDIEQQNKRTAAFNEDARISQIKRLKQKNIELQQQIDKLEQENKAKYEAIQKHTYDVGNGMVATRDPTLLENMRATLQQHVQQVKKIQQEIHRNKSQIQTLSVRQ